MIFQLTLVAIQPAIDVKKTRIVCDVESNLLGTRRIIKGSALEYPNVLNIMRVVCPEKVDTLVSRVKYLSYRLNDPARSSSDHQETMPDSLKGLILTITEEDSRKIVELTPPKPEKIVNNTELLRYERFV